MDRQALIEAALAAGWTFMKASLYDEEGIEGWRWDGPDGQEHYSHSVDGDWNNGPEVPDQVRLLVDDNYRAEVEQARAERRRFADFLAKLMEG